MYVSLIQRRRPDLDTCLDWTCAINDNCLFHNALAYSNNSD